MELHLPSNYDNRNTHKMSTTTSQDSVNHINSNGQQTNVSVFTPANPTAIDNLQQATIFTRLETRFPLQRIQTALNSSPDVHQTFCTCHLGTLLIFDTNPDTHVEHVRAVLQMLGANSITAVLSACVFNAPTSELAGFQLMYVGQGTRRAVMLVDVGKPGT